MAASRGVGKSGLTSADLTKYANCIDIYPNSGSNNTYSNRILGDATGEMGPFSNYKNSWYADLSYFVASSYPWFNRGGSCDHGSDASQFLFSGNTGEGQYFFGVRLVLAVK